MHIQFNSSRNVDMVLPRNFYRTFLASGYLQVNQKSNVVCLIHINNSQSCITPLQGVVSTESLQSDWNFSCRSGDCLPAATRAFWVLFWTLVFLVTTSIKEWNPVYTWQLNSRLEIWAWGGGDWEREICYWACKDWKLHALLPVAFRLFCKYQTKNMLKYERPNWCHLLFYFTSYVLNMFRTLIYPSSGTCDCVHELPHR